MLRNSCYVVVMIGMVVIAGSELYQAHVIAKKSTEFDAKVVQMQCDMHHQLQQAVDSLKEMKEAAVRAERKVPNFSADQSTSLLTVMFGSSRKRAEKAALTISER